MEETGFFATKMPLAAGSMSVLPAIRSSVLEMAFTVAIVSYVTEQDAAMRKSVSFSSAVYA